MITTGTSSQPRVRRMVRVSVNPSMPGISTSESTRSTGVPAEPAGAVQAVDGGDDVVAGALEDHPLQLAHPDGVLDDQHARLAGDRAGAAAGRTPACAATGAGRRLSGCRTASWRTASSRTSSTSTTLPSPSMVAPATVGQPAEEGAELLDDELELALERVDGPGQQLAGAAVAGRRRRRAGRGRRARRAPRRGRPAASCRPSPERAPARRPTSWRSASARPSVSTTPVTGHGVALVADPGDEAAQDAERDRQRDHERGADARARRAPRWCRRGPRPTVRTTSRPTPRPEVSVTSSRVEKPGENSSCEQRRRR